jgi:hypothetical protein
VGMGCAVGEGTQWSQCHRSAAIRMSDFIGLKEHFVILLHPTLPYSGVLYLTLLYCAIP